MLEKVKLSLKITTNDFDDEIIDLIEASKLDLGISGVESTSIVDTDALIIRAITTYCKMNWGSPSDYDRLKASYDEQKAQLSMNSNYTDFGE
ncbi:MAG: head-tail connector protein [Bacteroidales bacterium]|nr:head-tail connector protein [Candidatus Scybalousia scybalohippi]